MKANIIARIVVFVLMGIVGTLVTAGTGSLALGAAAVISLALLSHFV